ncbi:MAG TPA: hypothetical protein VHU19_17800 [Pyrinomonadaceae bacterium]|jgi:hypothetical protein|nr:hypothetical protein [Pyrinomonadaceae bacterium]
MRPNISRQLRAVFIAAAFIFLSAAAVRVAPAQSNDPSYPAAVFTNDISGRIAPRDVGDARPTRHFYTFRGTEGDLTITFDSTELTGDVDVFTATTLRPLLKFTLLGDTAHLTKSFYVRSEETLVLRVEARAVGDVEGSYRIQFGGSFEPAPAGLSNAQQPVEPTVSSTASRGRNVRRVTSTGARIEEPKPAPTPADVSKESEVKPSPTPADNAAESKASATPRSTGRARASASRARAGTPRPRPATKAPATSTADTKPATEAGQPVEAKSETKTESETSPAPPAKTTAAPRRRAARAPRSTAGSASAGESGSTTQPAPGATPAPTQPAPTQRLVIVTRDGEMIERDMSTVRRVTVEGNQIVVVTKDGKIIRQPLTNVQRMSIEP